MKIDIHQPSRHGCPYNILKKGDLFHFYDYSANGIQNHDVAIKTDSGHVYLAGTRAGIHYETNSEHEGMDVVLMVQLEPLKVQDKY